MQAINDFLRSQPALDGNSPGFQNYSLMGIIGMVLMVLAVIFYLVRMKPKFIDALKGLAIAAISYYFAIYAHRFLQWYRVGFDPDRYFSVAANLAVSFTLLPLVAWLCAKTFNTSVGFAGDLAAVTLLAYHIPGRSGCMFTGCCYGFPCEWGIYSHRTDANQFPTVWVESLFTLAILVFIIVRICRKGYVPDGKNLPYMLLFYGICRFFSEMTRESTREHWLFWRFSDIHIHMLVMAAVGAFLLWRIAKKERAAEAGEEPPMPILKGRRK